jgi:hypothetical protein
MQGFTPWETLFAHLSVASFSNIGIWVLVKYTIGTFPSSLLMPYPQPALAVSIVGYGWYSPSRPGLRFPRFILAVVLAILSCGWGSGGGFPLFMLVLLRGVLLLERCVARSLHDRPLQGPAPLYWVRRCSQPLT